MREQRTRHEAVYSKEFNRSYYKPEKSHFGPLDFIGDGAMEDFFSHRSEDSVSANYSPSEYTREHYLYIQTTGHFYCIDGYYCERKGLASLLLIYTLSGTGHLLYHDTEYELKAGNCVLIDCMEYHKYDTNTKWEFVYIHFYGKEAPYYYQQFSEDKFHPFSIQSTFGLDSKVYRMMSLVSKSPVHHEMIVHEILTSIVTEVILNARNEILVLPEYISEVQNYINQNIRNKITLDSIAFEISLSKFYLSHEFKKYTNMTIQEYINNRRVANAKLLLLYTGLSIAEIAEYCGLQTTSYFIKLFKASEGESPYQWRKKWKSL